MNPGLLRLQFVRLQAIKTRGYEGLGTRLCVSVCKCECVQVYISASNLKGKMSDLFWKGRRGATVSLLLPSGILHLYQFKLLEFHSIEEVGQFLGTLPSSLDSETLFSHISSINLTSKHFSQVLQLQLPQR